MNITLVGFMGTGKTVAAKKVAKELGMKYVDIDQLIVRSEGKSINKIFSENGEPYFRKVEKKISKEISRNDNQVISSGGGIVLDEENIKNLEKNGVVICLEASPEAIYQRTKKHSHRPLLNVDEPVEKIKELLLKRKPYYNRIGFKIDTTRLSVEEVANKVIEIFNARKDCC